MRALPIEQQITFLYTRDLAATADFYENVLGLPLVRDQGSCRIYRVCPNAYIGFCEQSSALGTSEDQQPTKGIIFTIVTPAVDEWYEKLSAQGVSFAKPPAENPKYHIYHCFLRDPNDYLIEIQCFHDPLE